MTRAIPVVAAVLAALLVLAPVGVAAGGAPVTVDEGANGVVDDRSAADPAPERAETAQPDHENDSDNDSSVNVSVGQQLSTVVAVTDEEVQQDFEETELEVELESDNESERAEAIADRAEELRERAGDIREEYGDAVEARQEGELTRSEFAQRLAVLNGRAESLLRSYETLRDRAGNVSDLELRSAGLNRTAVQTAVDDLDSVTGTGPGALLARFTGESDGEVEIENENGLSIEVESEDGERSREIEQPGDGDANVTLDGTEALGVARGALTETNGTWILEKTTVDAEHGVYEFEFELQSGSLDGDAEVGVDGSSGDVVALEEKIEREDDEREEEDEGENDEEAEDDEGDGEEGGEDDESDEEESDEEEGDDEEGDEEERDEEESEGDDESDEGEDDESDEGEDDESDEGEADLQRELALVPTGSDAAPNATVTVQALLDGEPASNLTVTMNEAVVGTTDQNGLITVTLPDGDAKLTAELEDAQAEAEGELEYAFGGEGDDEAREDEERFLEAFAVDASLDNGTVDLAVAYEGSPVAGATVYDDGDRVGTTDENGTLAFDTDATEELELTVERGELEVELAYTVDGNALTLEESDVNVGDDERENEGEGDEEEGEDGESDDEEGEDAEGDEEEGDEAEDDDSDEADGDDDADDTDDEDDSDGDDDADDDSETDA